LTSVQAMIAKDNAGFSAAKIVGLIADTHIPSKAKSIPQEVFRVFANVDFIIHAGDLVELSVIDELEQLGPVLAVHGNMDSSEISNALPELNSLKVCDKKIGVMHDPGALFGLSKMRQIAKQNSFDAFVFGHTHSSSLTWEAKTLFINPGSPTSPAGVMDKPSIALLKITKHCIFPEIIPI
jgi:uncharacterized protein